jgi:Carboxypeptidase regulatory-like domain
MLITTDPIYVELPAGQVARVSVTITNTSSLIDAYDIRAFGLDPKWITVTPDRLSLFPEETGTIEATITLPEKYPAGPVLVAVHVQSANDSTDFSLAQVNLDVGTRPNTTLRVDPTMIIGGNKAQFGVIVSNDGNATIDIHPTGVDPEDKAEITFDPPSAVLGPGHRQVIQAAVKGGRPWFGQPKPRIVTFGLVGQPVATMGTFLQRPRIGRWLISLLGLITVAAIFAAVLSRTFNNVANESKVDPALLNQALANDAQAGAVVPVNPSSVTGSVVSFTTGEGVGGVQAELFSAANGAVPLASAATDSSGAYAFTKLGKGTYRIRFAGAGFAAQWFESAATFADATDITVDAGTVVPLPALELGGRPGSVKGKVTSADPTGAKATLLVPGVTDPTTKANVLQVDVSADGSFLFEKVPSPAQYQLVVEKPGFATEVRDIVLGAAQELAGIEVILRQGDGVISGRIQSPDGALGGVTVEATDGTTKIGTVSLTETDIGFFAMRGLPTPGTYNVTFTRKGFTSESRTIVLTAAQQVGDTVITLAPATGSITGTTGLTGVGPAGGITVTITGGEVNIKTVGATAGNVGQWVVESLPVPATYTITFSRVGFVSQTRLEDLDPLAGTANLAGIDATLVAGDAVIRGTVRRIDGTPVPLATVSLTDGTNTLRLVSANDPVGQFEFANVAPGTYTLTASLPGTSPAVVLVNVNPGEVQDVDISLQVRASVFGQVLVLDTVSQQFVPFSGATVRLFLATNFPGTPSQAAAVVTTDATGRYEFLNLEAPENYIVAVYASPTAADPLDSELAQTIPSQAVELPVFRVRAVF